MPLIKVQTSLPNSKNHKEILEVLSNELSQLTGKSENYVMTILETNVAMSFGGSDDPSCYVEIKSIGSIKQDKMSESFCRLISNKLDIPPNRIYISFEDVDGQNWGFNGRTFG